MENLPRDMQLEIIKCFDMETRIKCGIVSKLVVPETLVARLNKVNTYKVCHVLQDNCMFMLCQPYCTYLSVIGPHAPDVWLDQWYEKDWPLHRKELLQWYNEGNTKLKIVEAL